MSVWFSSAQLRRVSRIAESLGLIDPGTSTDNGTAELDLAADGGPKALHLVYDAGLGRWDVTFSFAAGAEGGSTGAITRLLSD